MTKTFTYDDVVRYIYSETTSEENDQIALALTRNEDLMSFYTDILEIRRQMNLISCQPPIGIVQSIMAHSALTPNLLQSVPSV